MVVQKQHLVAVAFLIVLAVAYFAQKEEGHRADVKQRNALVTGCQRTSARTAVIAAWTLDASRTRAASGDKDAAARYEGYAIAIRESIPAVPAHKGDPKIADVEEINNPRTGKLTYRLTDDAKALQQAGCEFVYPAP
jgi:hypothetical protein